MKPAPPSNPKAAPIGGSPPPPRRSAPHVSPPPPIPPTHVPQPSGDGFDIVAAFMKWVGPAFIVLGMIYGAVFLVETDVFGPPERLVAGIAVTLGFGWLGQYFIKREQKLLGELVTGTFFAGAFLCSWAVPAVTGWPVGTSILLSGAVGLLALAYSWMRNDSTGFAMGIVGLAGLPISGPLYSDFKFLDTVEDLYGQTEMIVPLVLFTVLAFGLRLAKGWFMPWALSIAALSISFGYTIEAGTDMFGAQLVMVGVIAASALLGVVRVDVDDESIAQRFLGPIFNVFDSIAPVYALFPVWVLVQDLNLTSVGERVTMGAWAALTLGLAVSLYSGIEAWGVKASPGRRIGGVLSALFALLIAVGDLNWYVYVVMLAAAFVVSIVAGDSVEQQKTAEDKSFSTSLLELIQTLLGMLTATGLLLMILTGLAGPLADDLPTLISAWAAAGLFAAGFYLRPELRVFWGVPYTVALGLLAASIGGGPVMLMVTSAGWLLAGFAAVKFGLKSEQRTALAVGLGTVAVAVAKFVLVDTPQAEGNLMRAVSFLVAGLVIVLLSADSNEIRRVLRMAPALPAPPAPLAPPTAAGSDIDS